MVSKRGHEGSLGNREVYSRECQRGGWAQEDNTRRVLKGFVRKRGGHRPATWTTYLPRIYVRNYGRGERPDTERAHVS